jgi:tRNA ligase
VKDDIKRNPSLFESYTKGHGIIATRERFLKWLETDEGKREKRKAEIDKEATQPLGKEFGKTTIMPIAVPGIGYSHPSSAHGIALLHTSSRQNINHGGSNGPIPVRTHTER